MYCFFVGKKYVSCYASAPKYSAVLAHNSVDLFFLSQLQLNNTEKWTHLRSCLVKSDDCNNLSKRYKVTSDLAIGIFRRLIYYCSCSICYFLQTLKQYKLAELTPMESGCCRPPAEYAPEPFTHIKTLKILFEKL
jgi:hypothetical protein